MNYFSKTIAGIAVLSAMGVSGLVSAQIYDGPGFAQNQDLNFQTTVTFKIPLGSTDRRRVADKPRLGLGLSLARDDFGSPLGKIGSRYEQKPLNLLDIGAYGFERPSLQISGQEVYGPTFTALHADGTTDETSGSKSNKTLLLVGGAVVAIGAGALVFVEVNEAIAEGIVNCTVDLASSRDCVD